MLVLAVVTAVVLGVVGMHALGGAPPSAPAAVHAVAVEQSSTEHGSSHHGMPDRSPHHGSPHGSHGPSGALADCVLAAGTASAALGAAVVGLLSDASGGDPGASLLLALGAVLGAVLLAASTRPATGPPGPASSCVLRT